MPEPRVKPLPFDEWHQDLSELRDAALASKGTRQLHVDGTPINLYGTLANHPRLLLRVVPFVVYALLKSRVPARDRELLILRTSRRCGADYEWGHHQQLAREAGLTDAEIMGILDDDYLWGDDDAAVLRAVDELHATCRISDATWAALATRYDQATLMDLVFTAAQYRLLAMAMRSFGIQNEEGFPGLPGVFG
jgi:4-carboxymuconolactone decarboxylase